MKMAINNSRNVWLCF